MTERVEFLVQGNLVINFSIEGFYYLPDRGELSYLAPPRQ
jgi:hypothetical protein